MNRASAFFRSLVNMTDHVDFAAASQSIRKNITFRGPNVIILACAIIIASVGLNVNSIPVIIGAMLISPVMGPILGFGFGLATRDNALVKEGLKNLLIMVSISILASTLYFLLSPLRPENPTELLARTNPTIYDVLIALFGGIAGVIEISRKEKGTVLSGVAIATALMPPLCTIGYGLSALNFSHVLGALYLFVINSIFIALATYLVAKYLHYPVVSDEQGEEKPRAMKPGTVAAILLLIVVPSIVSALNIVKESNFNSHVSKLVSEYKTLDGSFIYEYKVDFSSKPAKVDLFLAGDKMGDGAREKLFAAAEKWGIARTQIIFHEDATISRESMSESELIKGIYERSDMQVKSLTDSLFVLRQQLSEYRSGQLPTESVAKELSAQYPEITRLVLTSGSNIDMLSDSAQDQVVAIVSSQNGFDSETIDRMRRWLVARLGRSNVIVNQNFNIDGI